MRVSIGRLYGAVFACALGGCTGPGQVLPPSVEVNDNHVFVPNVRAGWDFTGAKEAPSEPRSGVGIEFEAMTASGSGSQSIDAGRQVLFGDKTFSPPQTLRNDFRFTYFDVSYRWRRFFRDGPVGLEVLAGPAYATYRLTVSSPTQQAAETFHSIGPSTGVGVIWRMRPGTSMQARFSYAILASSRGGADDVQRWEGFLVQALGQNAAMRAGWELWKFDSGVINFSGPSLGFELQF